MILRMLCQLYLRWIGIDFNEVSVDLSGRVPLSTAVSKTNNGLTLTFSVYTESMASFRFRDGEIRKSQNHGHVIICRIDGDPSIAPQLFQFNSLKLFVGNGWLSRLAGADLTRKLLVIFVAEMKRRIEVSPRY